MFPGLVPRLCSRTYLPNPSETSTGGLQKQGSHNYPKAPTSHAATEA